MRAKKPGEQATYLRPIVIYRCIFLLLIGYLYGTNALWIKSTWPFILLGLGGYIYYLHYGERPPGNSATYKLIFFFEIWMFIWNGFRWRSFTTYQGGDERKGRE